MSVYTEEIYNYIDKEMSENEAKEFIHRMNNDNELKEEFFMIRELNEHMKGKLTAENIKAENNTEMIEKDAREDVNEFISEGKTDKAVLDYLSKAYPENSSSVKNKIKEAEEDENIIEIEGITEGLVTDFMHDDNKEDGLYKLITSVSHDDEPEKDTPEIKFNKKFKIDKLKSRRLFYLASSVAAIFVLVLVLNNIFDNTPKNERIFAEFHDKPMQLNSIQVRDTEHDVDIVFEEASDLYQQNKFNEAYIRFNQLVTEDSTFIQALFYSGLAKFESGKYKESIQIFKRIISKFDVYEMESKWCLALAFIKINEISKAIPYLEFLAKQKNLFQKDANRILDQIKD